MGFFFAVCCFAKVTLNDHAKLYDILAYKENSAVYYNSKIVSLQWILLKESKLKKRLDFKQVLGVGCRFLVKAVLPVLVQGFREQHSYPAVSLLCGCLDGSAHFTQKYWSVSLVIKGINITCQRDSVFAAVISHFADRSDLAVRAPTE